MSNYNPKEDSQQLRDWLEMINLQSSLIYWRKQRETTHKTEYIDQTLEGLEKKYKEIKDQYFKVVK